jgi:hypothetical protein
MESACGTDREKEGQMGPIVLMKIGSLHARSVQETGLKLRSRGREFFSGTVVATLDESAEFPANTGLIDLATGTIQLRWGIMVALPFMADAFASGSVSVKESAPLRVSFEEVGQVRKDGSGFDVEGTGQVCPGTMLSSVDIPLQNNLITILPEPRKKTLANALTAGDVIRCALVRESYLDVVLPKSLGGGTQRLNLVGGFLLTPVMTLGKLQHPVKSRR